MQKAKISLIAAIGRHRELGKSGGLLWTIPDDLRRFKELTTGHPVIMGRKTYESIFAMRQKPLPNRTSIVLMREAEFKGVDPMFAFENVKIAQTPEAALSMAQALDSEQIFIIGGAQIYTIFLSQADRLYLTLIDDEKECDVYFPPYDDIFNKTVEKEDRLHNGLKYSWVTLEK